MSDWPVALLGCGSIGRRHLANLNRLGLRHVIAYDPSPTARDEAARVASVLTTGSLDEVWQARPKVALITAPTNLHIPLALEAARHGCHLFIEKPLAHNLEEVAELQNEVMQRELATLVGCNMRFHPGPAGVKRLLNEGVIGEAIAARLQTGSYLPRWRPQQDYRASYSVSLEWGGAVLDCIHEIDLARWFFGPADVVFSVCLPARTLGLQVDGLAELVLRHESQVLSSIHLNFIQRDYRRGCQIIGSEGTILWDFKDARVLVFGTDGEPSQTIRQPDGWDINDMYLEELRHLFEIVRGVARSTNPIEQGLATLRLALEARRRLRAPQQMKTVAIIQARMSSTRLPGKILADIAGRTMLERVVERVRQAKRIDLVVVATSSGQADDPVHDLCRLQAIPCFRGDEADVLDRFQHAATKFQADAVVRITADCPLIDPGVIDRVVAAFQREVVDYAANVNPGTFPDGLDVEVFSARALGRAWREAKQTSEREHVTPYLRFSGQFRTHNVANDIDLSRHRWTVDDPADLSFVRAVYSRFHEERDFGMNDVLDLLDQHPELQSTQGQAISNEGYFNTLYAQARAGAAPKRPLAQSNAWLARAEKVVPNASQTFSKSRSQYVQGVSPIFLRRGKGCRVWDVDGNEYIDYVQGLLPNILGYANDEVNAAYAAQLAEGHSFSLPHPLEVELAERLTRLIPCAEKVRFGKNGSDATAGAVRAARACTGRDRIACCGYHGWQDWYIGSTTRSAGVPAAVKALTHPFPYNDLAKLEQLLAQHRGEFAAIIMEPVNFTEPAPGYLQGVRELAHKHGALLVFDEICSGFHFGLGGAQKRFGVTPDLACFGKAMGNGFPIACVVGRSDVMKVFEEIFFSFTFGGEVASMAAALKVLDVLEHTDALTRMVGNGRTLQDGFNALAKLAGLSERIQCAGYPQWSLLKFKDANGADSLLERSLFQQETCKRGLLLLVTHNMTAAHDTAAVQQTLETYAVVLKTLSHWLSDRDPAVHLEGPMIQPVFRVR